MAATIEVSAPRAQPPVVTPLFFVIRPTQSVEDGMQQEPFTNRRTVV
jgi:hypothetical protein